MRDHLEKFNEHFKNKVHSNNILVSLVVKYIKTFCEKCQQQTSKNVLKNGIGKPKVICCLKCRRREMIQNHTFMKGNGKEYLNAYKWFLLFYLFYKVGKINLENIRQIMQYQPHTNSNRNDILWNAIRKIVTNVHQQDKIAIKMKEYIESLD